MKTKSGISFICNDTAHRYTTKDTVFSYEADKNRKGVIVTVANKLHNCASMGEQALDSLSFRANKEQLEKLAKALLATAAQMKNA